MLARNATVEYPINRIPTGIQDVILPALIKVPYIDSDDDVVVNFMTFKSHKIFVCEKVNFMLLSIRKKTDLVNGTMEAKKNYKIN